MCFCNSKLHEGNLKALKGFEWLSSGLVAVQYFGSCCLPAMLDFITPQNEYFPLLTVHTFPGHNSNWTSVFYFLQLVQFRHAHSTKHLKRDFKYTIFSHFQDNLTILASLKYTKLD